MHSPYNEYNNRTHPSTEVPVTAVKAGSFTVDVNTTHGYLFGVYGGWVDKTVTFAVKASVTPRTVSIYYFSDWDIEETQFDLSGITTARHLAMADLGTCKLAQGVLSPRVLRVTFNCATGATDQALTVTMKGAANTSQLVAVAVK